MAWCEDNALDYAFGLASNKVLKRLVDASADDIRIRRALEQKPVLRGYVETRYKAKSWKAQRRVAARIEVTTMCGLILLLRFACGHPQTLLESRTVDKQIFLLCMRLNVRFRFSPSHPSRQVETGGAKAVS